MFGKNLLGELLVLQPLLLLVAVKYSRSSTYFKHHKAITAVSPFDNVPVRGVFQHPIHIGALAIVNIYLVRLIESIVLMYILVQLANLYTC